MGTRLILEEQDPSALPLPEAPRVEFLRLPGQAQASGRRMALVSPESVLGCRLGLRLMEDGVLPRACLLHRAQRSPARGHVLSA